LVLLFYLLGKDGLERPTQLTIFTKNEDVHLRS
jgi:hypothetical protein